MPTIKTIGTRRRCGSGVGSVLGGSVASLPESGFALGCGIASGRVYGLISPVARALADAVGAGIEREDGLNTSFLICGAVDCVRAGGGVLPISPVCDFRLLASADDAERLGPLGLPVLFGKLGGLRLLLPGGGGGTIGLDVGGLWLDEPVLGKTGEAMACAGGFICVLPVGRGRCGAFTNACCSAPANSIPVR